MHELPSLFYLFFLFKGRDANDIKKVLDVLMKRINQVFERDFPFYFCVAGRLMMGQVKELGKVCMIINFYCLFFYSAKNVYHNVHHAERFHNLCAEKFEQLRCEVVANTLENFLSRYICPSIVDYFKFEHIPLFAYCITAL